MKALAPLALLTLFMGISACKRCQTDEDALNVKCPASVTAVCSAFRNASADDRQKESRCIEWIIAHSYGARAITQAQLIEYLGEPERIETARERTLLYYRVSRDAGQTEYLYVECQFGLALDTGRAWSIR
jgi:hypothetical protein